MGAAITGAPADKNDAGLVSFDDTMFTVDANGFVQLAGGSVGLDSLTGDDGVVVTGDGAGNINLVGSVVANATNAKPLYVDGDAGTFTQSLELQVASAVVGVPADTNDAGIASFDNTYFTVNSNGYVSQTAAGIDTAMANFIVDPNGTRAEYTTITAALAAASAGDTIGIKPGTYTENLTLKAGVDLISLSSDYVNGQVEIIGKLTYTAAGTVNLYNLKLTTNSDYFLEVTGANNSVMNIRNCYLNVTNNNGINITCTGASREIVFDGCYGDITTTLISYFIAGGSGGGYLGQGIFFKDCHLRNTGNSTAASTVTSTIRVEKCFFMFPLSFTAAGLFARFSEFNCNNTSTTALTTATSNTLDIDTCLISSGTASAISIGAGTSVTIYNSDVSSSNTNVITGASSIDYAGLNFTNTSSNINVTTQTLSEEGPSRIIGSSNAGSSNTLTTTNTDNTSTSSNSALNVSVGGTSGGDPYTNYAVGSTISYCLGIDNTDSDILKLNTIAGALATPSTGTNLWKMTSAGEVTMPLQPAFLAYLGTSDSNVTGNGATYVLGSGNALTEVFDQGGDFVTTGTFTAPVTGRYSLASNFVMGDITAAMTFQGMNITTSNRTYQFGFQNDGTVQTVAVVPGIISTHGSVLADMDAADTFTTSIAISGGVGNTADSSPTGARIFMSGFLAC